MLGFDDLAENRLLAFWRELDSGILAFHPFLQKPAFFDIGNMHIFKAHRPTIIGAQRIDELTDRGPFKAKCAADIDTLVEVGAGKAMIFWRQIGRYFLLRQAKRVKIGGQMTTDAVRAHQHHCADGIARSSHCIGLRHRLARRLCRCLYFDCHLRGVKRRGQIVRCRQWPVGTFPTRPALYFEILVFYAHFSSPNPPRTGEVAVRRTDGGALAFKLSLFGGCPTTMLRMVPLPVPGRS